MRAGRNESAKKIKIAITTDTLIKKILPHLSNLFQSFSKINSSSKLSSKSQELGGGLLPTKNFMALPFFLFQGEIEIQNGEKLFEECGEYINPCEECGEKEESVVYDEEIEKYIPLLKLIEANPKIVNLLKEDVKNLKS